MKCYMSSWRLRGRSMKTGSRSDKSHPDVLALLWLIVSSMLPYSNWEPREVKAKSSWRYTEKQKGLKKNGSRYQESGGVCELQTSPESLQSHNFWLHFKNSCLNGISICLNAFGHGETGEGMYEMGRISFYFIMHVASLSVSLAKIYLQWKLLGEAGAMTS